MGKKPPPKIRKRPKSSFGLWRDGVPMLADYQKLVLNALKSVPDTEDDRALEVRRLDIMDRGLRLNREIRETVLAEARLRREVADLRKTELDGMTDDKLEELLLNAARARGMRALEPIRIAAAKYLTERGASEQAAWLIVDQLIPDVIVRPDQRGLEMVLKNQLNAMEEDFERGSEDLRTALEGNAAVAQSDGQPLVPVTEIVTKGPESGPDSN